MENDPVPIPKAVFEGLEAIRRSGFINMLDRPGVIEIAEQCGFHEAANWVHENRSLYAHGLFQGFQIIEEEDRPCADSAE